MLQPRSSSRPVRHSSDAIEHSWPPSNVLTQSILTLIRENVHEKDKNDNFDVDITYDSSHIQSENDDVDSAPRNSLPVKNSTLDDGSGETDVGSPERTFNSPFPVVVDMTFGDGFHSGAILREFQDESLILFAMDRDPKAVELAGNLSKEEGRTVVPIHAK